jgi:hypothetical protein
VRCLNPLTILTLIHKEKRACPTFFGHALVVFGVQLGAKKNSCKLVFIRMPFTIFVVKSVFYNEMLVFSLRKYLFFLVAEGECPFA